MPKRSKKRRRRRQRRDEPIHLVIGEEHDDCPLCAALKDAERIDLTAIVDRFDMVDITLFGDATTWPHLPLEGRTEKVPKNTTIRDYIELMLDLVNPSLLDGGPVQALVNGELSRTDRVIQHGDEITLTRPPPHPESRSAC